jgi:receptor protein-tyrosine kinase
MGRIEEALRRAVPKDPQVKPVDGQQQEDVFVSAWTFGAVPDQVVPDQPAEVDSTRAEPSPGLHVVWPSLLARFKPEWRERLALTGDVERGLAEQFRRLAATLLHSQRGENIRSVMITSAVPADGKTLTALNLALILSESYKRRVLLIDGDLRRPTISEAMNLTSVEGLSEVIGAADERRVPLVQLTETLTLLPAGRPDPDPLSGITSARMQQLLHEAAERFDWVILDTPPVGVAADAGLLCPMVDGTLLVVRAGRTPYKAIERALETIGRDRLLGVVLNGVEDQGQSDYDGSYYYSYYSDNESAKS